MISIRVLSTAAAIGLVVAIAAPTPSFAQGRGTPRGGVHMGGGGGVHVGGGGPHFGGGGWHGGYGGGYRRGGGGGFIPGAVAGAVIGGAIASQGYYGDGYYGSSYGYAPGYYDDQYYDDGAVAVAPAGGDDGAYCAQTYRSYDPASGTYLGYDGLRHLCP